MNMESQELHFEPLLCQNRAYCTYERPFNPVAHDLIVSSEDGRSKIAKNASVGQMANMLGRLNHLCSGVNGGNDDNAAALIIIRFEEDDDDHDTQVREVNDWSQLWPYFDSCCNDESSSRDFVSKLRHGEPQCYSSVSKTSISEEFGTIQCNKISYGLNFLHKRILLAHHFHNINGTMKEMIRVVTCGMPQESIEAILCKALYLAKSPSSGSATETATEGLESAVRLPHPKSILCGMLLCIEEYCRKNLSVYQNSIQKILDSINEQRDPGMRKPKGLEIQSVKLGDTIINLVEIRQKVQYLLTSITSIEDMPGLPSFSDFSSGEELDHNTFERLFSHQWSQQLQLVNTNLLELQRRCQQDIMKVENLQERVKGILSIISILQVEIENERAARSRERDKAASDYQMAMLERQELIAVRTKRDNTVMKVIAVLSALFLPGTFIATVFSVPVFNWDQENPIGPHFRIYWVFTVPITMVLVFGLSIWLLKMRQEDLKADKDREKRELSDDVEFNGGSIKKAS